MGARYPPWHIPHLLNPWHSVCLLQRPRDTLCPPCLSCSLPWQQRGNRAPGQIRIMLPKRGGASWIPRMMPNMMTKRMFFLSHMRLLERSSGSKGGWLHLIQPQSLRRIASNSCRGLFHPNQQMRRSKRPRVPLLHLLQCAGRRASWTTS